MLSAGFYNMDCLEAMREFPDKFFSLSVVDPPYGIDINMNMGRRKGEARKHDEKAWDNSIPNDEYFKELFRVSENQIIWGGNYFNLPTSQAWIYWHKSVPEGVSFSDGELAWTSFDRALKEARIPYSGFNGSEGKIHPTQKPISLYVWILKNYAKRGDKILDTHVGSASSLIACHRMGFEAWGFELDVDYFRAASERLEKEKAMSPLFEPQEIYKQEGLTFDQ
ncbi:MAG: DNA methyltransferase [Clostridiaceae bacterium]